MSSLFLEKHLKTTVDYDSFTFNQVDLRISVSTNIDDPLKSQLFPGFLIENLMDLMCSLSFSPSGWPSARVHARIDLTSSQGTLRELRHPTVIYPSIID